MRIDQEMYMRLDTIEDLAETARQNYPYAITCLQRSLFVTQGYEPGKYNRKYNNG